MGLGNKAQAFMLGLSAFLIVLGGATASIPDLVPQDIKIPLSIFLWVCGIIGFALKEALGSAYATPEPPQ
jgi:hypothetical protein